MEDTKRSPSESTNPGTFVLTKTEATIAALHESGPDPMPIYYSSYLCIFMGLLSVRMSNSLTFVSAVGTVFLSWVAMSKLDTMVFASSYNILFYLIWLLSLRRLSFSNECQKRSISWGKRWWGTGNTRRRKIAIGIYCMSSDKETYFPQRLLIPPLSCIYHVYLQTFKFSNQ